MVNGNLTGKLLLHMMREHGLRSMTRIGVRRGPSLGIRTTHRSTFHVPNNSFPFQSRVGVLDSVTRNHFHTTCNHRDSNGIPSNPDEPPLAHALRKLMRVMPHSVVVATVSTGDDTTPASFKGMTVSSFTTLTLTPTPIITFNIKKPSQTLEAIRQSRHFLIHILSATESGALVADAFTKGNEQNVFFNPAFKVLMAKDSGSSNEPPLLSAEGITKVLRCTVREQPGGGLLDIGDHTLVLGDVVSIIEPPQKDLTDDKERRGLCYLDREYRHVGSVIKLTAKV